MLKILSDLIFNHGIGISAKIKIGPSNTLHDLLPNQYKIAKTNVKFLTDHLHKIWEEHFNLS